VGALLFAVFREESSSCSCSDFDDAPADDGQPSGLAATEVLSQPAAANLLAGTSSNPLDDLVSIFGGGGSGDRGRGLSIGAPASFSFGNGGVGHGFGAAMLSPAPLTATSLASPIVSQAPNLGAAKPPPPRQAQDDLLGLF
jgi:AP-1 complex subunit beta-1